MKFFIHYCRDLGEHLRIRVSEAFRLGDTTPTDEADCQRVCASLNRIANNSYSIRLVTFVWWEKSKQLFILNNFQAFLLLRTDFSQDWFDISLESVLILINNYFQISTQINQYINRGHSAGVSSDYLNRVSKSNRRKRKRIIIGHVQAGIIVVSVNFALYSIQLFDPHIMASVLMKNNLGLMKCPFSLCNLSLEHQTLRIKVSLSMVQKVNPKSTGTSPKSHASISLQKPFASEMRNHNPVMAKEVIEYLAPKENQVFLDMTFGAGGHSRKILEKSPKVRVLCLDRDPLAYDLAKELQEEYPGRVIPLLGKFRQVFSFHEIWIFFPNRF